MSIQQLPAEVLGATLHSTSPEELFNFCQSASGALDFCQSPQFLSQYVMNNYGVNINDIPGNTYWDKFKNIYSLINAANTANLNDITVSNILNQAAQTNDISIYQKIQNTLIRRIGDSRSFNSSFRTAFLTSLNNDNPNITRYILYFYKADNDRGLEDALEDAVKSGNINLVSKLDKYNPILYPEDLIILAEKYNQPAMANFLIFKNAGF
jgi:hypothetical protein